MCQKRTRYAKRGEVRQIKDKEEVAGIREGVEKVGGSSLPPPVTGPKRGSEVRRWSEVRRQKAERSIEIGK